MVARGRRYFSNDALLAALRGAAEPVLRIPVGPSPAVDVYALDRDSLPALSARPPAPRR